MQTTKYVAETHASCFAENIKNFTFDKYDVLFLWTIFTYQSLTILMVARKIFLGYKNTIKWSVGSKLTVSF